jgi:RNA-directed DNA polymerase
MRRKQKTPKEADLQKEGVEPRDMQGAQSMTTASEVRRNDGQAQGAEKEGLLEKVIERNNLNKAYKQVKANRGSHGVDGMEVEELLPYLKRHGEDIRQGILKGEYQPQPVRRVEIPKADGGIRLLGIPTVLDRLIQQAIAQVLNSLFEPQFSESSYGFREGRSAKQAIKQAQGYINSGYRWVVDIDLAKYFDTVNHDKLMELVARKVGDKRVLKLIRLYLESGVVINGVVVETEDGCPQGGPLSPLLSNIMLDELDKELEKRGHKFCRYADDNNIYVKSQRAGARVMQSITGYLERKLKLKVNSQKSAVDRPWKRKFLGFSFYPIKGGVGIRVHAKPVAKLRGKVKEVLSRSNGWSTEQRIKAINSLIIGWINYFGIADMRKLAGELDEWIRRRLRMCIWKQWHKVQTRHANLMQLGIESPKAWGFANTRKGCWRISNSPILNGTLTSEYLDKLGYVSLTKRYSIIR